MESCVKKPKPYNQNTMTLAAYRSMIISGLREKSRWWKPAQECKRLARQSKGRYLCASCKTIGPATIKGTYKNGKPRKINNAVIDHVHPVVSPYRGFECWDTYISRMFCVLEGFQLLCHKCHEAKTTFERDIATARKRREKDEGI